MLVITLLPTVPAAAEATREFTTLAGVAAVVTLLTEVWTLVKIEAGDNTGYETTRAFFLAMLLTGALAVAYFAAAFSAPGRSKSREPMSWMDRFRAR